MSTIFLAKTRIFIQFFKLKMLLITVSIMNDLKRNDFIVPDIKTAVLMQR